MNTPYIVNGNIVEPKPVQHARIPSTWARILRRMMALSPGRYQIVLTVEGESLDWSVMPLGKLEQ